MSRIVITGFLLVAAGTALVYSGNRRASQASVEAETHAEAVTQTELDSSNRARPIYAEVLSGIRGYLQQRIAESGDSRITIDLPALPTNLYEGRYSGTVIFGDVAVWTVEVFTRRPVGLRSPPTLTIRFDEPTEPQEGPRLIFAPDPLAGEVAIVFANGVVPSVGPLPTVIPEEDSETAIAQLTKSIIEGQLLRMER